tara:strand:+ start:761 stop:2206 length:1446 start_codon:yes stop_codon:yes gene_type:complete
MQNQPVVIGVSCLQQKESFDKLDESLVLMEKAALAAISDTTNKDIKNFIDEIQIPKGYWRYRDPGKWIAKRNNLKKDLKTYITKIGVLQQSLINTACNRIINGEINASLILGGESRYKKLRAKIENKNFLETELNKNPDFYVKAAGDLQLDIEEKELGNMAVGYYSIMESSKRSSSDFDNHHKMIAETYQSFSKVASKNPLAWSDKYYSTKEILNATKNNPPQAFPYNKLHCASWNINQAAGIIICSEKLADSLNIPSNKRVYPIASSENNHMIATIQRPNLSKSAGMKLASEFILKICKENNLKPSLYDLYSCFPVAVQMFAEYLELNNLKNATISGGMSFAGGPLNSYVLNATAQMIKLIRKNNKVGIVTGVSGMMTKQSFALWSKKPCNQFYFKDVTNNAKKTDIPFELSNSNKGRGIVIGYTVLYLKQNPHKGVIYIEDKSKKRKIITTKDRVIMKSMRENEWVGRLVQYEKDSLVV